MIDTTTYWPDRLRVLISYAYLEALEFCADRPEYEDVELLVDSGAFTAHTMGKEIPIGAYTDWLLAHHQRVQAGIVLDVIGDHLGTARNHEWMLNRLPEGFPLMPVWHSTSPLSELERLCREHDYIGIGGIVSMSSQIKTFMAHMVRVHLMAREHGTKLHGLGVTGETAMFKLPWHTVDSSSWLSGSRYGRLRLRDESMKIVAYRVGDPLPPKIARLIRLYDGNPLEARSKGFGLKTHFDNYSEQYHWMQESSGRSYMLAEGNMRKKHDPAARLYLATGTSNAFSRIVKGYAKGNPFK